MSCKRLKGWHSDILWNILVGATLFVCMYITYQFLLLNGIICLNQSECVEESNPTSEQLFQEECSSFCNTKDCTDISQRILQSMNKSADPCEDFSNFACGLYYEKFTDGNTYWILNDDTMGELHLQVTELLDDISRSTPTDDNSATYKLKLVYESCMNKGSSETVSVSSIEQFLSSVGIVRKGSSFAFNNTPLYEVLGKLSAYRESQFIQLVRKSRSRKPSLNQLKVISANGLHYSSRKDNLDELNALEAIMNDILPYFFTESDAMNNALRNFKDVRFFLKENRCADDSNRRLEKLKCADENKNHLVCQFAESYVVHADLSPFYGTDQIAIGCTKDTLDTIVDFLKNTDERIIANYIAINVFVKNLADMGFFFRRQSFKIARFHDFKYDEEIYAAEKYEKQFCITWIMRKMKSALGGPFVSRYWPTTATDDVDKMYQDYLQEAKSSVRNQNWIVGKSKEDLLLALGKAKNILDGLIQDFRNQSFVNSLYEKFHPSGTSFIFNVLEHNKLINTVEELVDIAYFNRYYIEDPFETVLMPFTNAAYGHSDLYLSFGILTSPFYRFDYPRLFNLAKIGGIIGHEIGHIINYFIVALGSKNETFQNWEKKKSCILKQYSKFKFKHHQDLSDEFLLAIATTKVPEDLSDTMGLIFTENVSKPFFTAMENEDFMIPGLSYSPEQLLYIAFEQVFCAVRTADFERKSMRNDDHSQPENRIKGPLQNSERFSKAFNCPSMAYMNPKDKCRLFE